MLGLPSTIEAVEAVAKLKPLYAVFRDASFANDSAAANFEELFKTYSPTPRGRWFSYEAS